MIHKKGTFMKLLFIAALTLSFTSSALAERMATLQTEYGETAYLVAEHPPQGDEWIMSFGKLTVEINGNEYRIDYNSSDYVFSLLCAPFRPAMPYDYNTAETRNNGFLFIGGERVVKISEQGIVSESEEEVVMLRGECRKEMF